MMAGATTMARRRWDAIGTWCELVVNVPERYDGERVADEALRLAELRVHELDLACSRFRDDSELANLPHGSTTTVSQLLSDALAVALRTARLTDGLVDPTVAGALRDSGYDADFDAVRARPDRPDARVAGPVPGFRRVFHDPVRRLVLLPDGVELDLGASAKAWLADRLAGELNGGPVPDGGGVLVALGGDVAVAGTPPAGGWRLSVEDGSDGAAPLICLTDGGVATSSTRLRRWRQGGQLRHHIIDPRTGRTAPSTWYTVTVAARSCELANAASTAAVVLGDAAPRWLAQRGLHARLRSASGSLQRVGGWPEDEA